MELWLSIESSGVRAEVVVDAAPDTPVATLATALAGAIGEGGAEHRLFHKRTNGWLSPTSTIDEAQIVDGDHLGVDVGLGSSPRSFDGHSRVTVVGGPCAGQTFPVGSSETVIGRGAEADIQLKDRSLSRRHLVARITGSGVSIEDLGSSNGTFIEGIRVTDHVAVAPGSVVECGSTLLRLDVGGTSRSAMVKPSEGVVAFNRPPRQVRFPRVEVVRVPAPPKRPEHQRFSTAQIVAPAVLGVVMALVFKSPALLSLAFFSPAIGLWQYFEERKRGGGSYTTRLAKYWADIDDAERGFSTSLEGETILRRSLDPDPADIVDRALEVRSVLWERRPADEDFLVARVGWGDVPAALKLEPDEGGDEAERAKLLTRLERYALARAVPVSVPLLNRVTGLCGPAEATISASRWMVVSAAVMQSPRDLVIGAALPSVVEGEWEWLRWLPHCREEGWNMAADAVTFTPEGALALVGDVAALISARREQAQSSLGGSAHWEPAVMVVLHDGVQIPRSTVSTLLEEGPGFGVSVLWIGRDRDALPGACSTVVEVTADGRFAMGDVSGSIVSDASSDWMSLEQADAVARALAPIRDLSSGGGRGQIPRQVSLPELLDLDVPSPAGVAERWRTADAEIDGVIGVSLSGPFRIDIRHDGPHALIGGTTGAGKSELLQTLVAALASAHPPNRLTFLLVDYKGGAAFKDCVDLPHTVGFVTDLDGHLVHRALVSLQAELQRREHILKQAGVKDLPEMEHKLPDEAPPSLLLIVDEFAALAKELPDFVDGVVDVAQRGRSLGIHLVLATQRPSGAINDNIRANTNLRIALRMNDVSDSEDVIDAKDAALLPRTLPGRGYARTGAGELTEFQGAYAGGRYWARDDEPEIRVWELGPHAALLWPPPGEELVVRTQGPTDLQLLVQGMVGASELLEIAPPVPPWLPALPSLVTLESLGEPATRTARLGLVDLPGTQEQEPFDLSLRSAGGLLVYGSSGAGKTTVLRTLAASLATTNDSSSIHLYALDFASLGLVAVGGLPQCGAVITGNEIDRTQRLFKLVREEMQRRRDVFSVAGVSSLGELEDSPPPEGVPPRIVILLDGYQTFAATFEKVDYGSLVEELPRLVSAGVGLGIHFVLTADRQGSVSYGLTSTIGTKLALRLTDRDEYTTIGFDIRSFPDLDLAPGRALIDAATELQVAVVGDSASGEAQIAALRSLGAQLREAGQISAPPIGELPETITTDELAERDLSEIALGILDEQLDELVLPPVKLRLAVFGPRRSGRSNLLRVAAAGLQRIEPDIRIVVLAPRPSPLADAFAGSRVARTAEECERVVADLRERLLADPHALDELALIVDDGEELVDTDADEALEALVREARDSGLRILVGGDATGARRAYGGFIPLVRSEAVGILLNPDADIDGDLFGVDLPRRRDPLPPGRGYIVRAGVAVLMQSALSTDT